MRRIGNYFKKYIDQCDFARGAYRRYRSVVGGLMNYPTYSEATRQRILRSGDPVRYQTIALAIERLMIEQLKGAFAEVGVYQGETSEFIHSVAPDRSLYLFDTFAGFPESDALGDIRFRNTTEEIVRQRVGGNSNVIIRKGFVPKTFAGLEKEQFSLVLLDLD